MQVLRSIVLLGCVLACQSSVPLNSDPATTYLQQIIDAGRNPAISAAIYAEGRARFISVGLANPVSGIPANEHTIYRVGSITKAFTGTVIQELALMGVLSPTSSVDHYLGRQIPATSFRQPTIEELLQMRGGVPHGWYYSESARLTAATIDERYSAITGNPGQNFDYSNFSYGLLADAAATQLHLSHRELFARYLFAPLSMNDSSILAPASSDSRLAVPYGSNMLPAREEYLYPAGAAGGFTSAADLMSFALFNIGEKAPIKPLKADVAARVHGETTFYSNGWGQVRIKGGSYLWVADGEAIGGCATVLLLPTEKIATVVLTNVCHAGQTDEIAAHLLRIHDDNLGSEAESLFNSRPPSAPPIRTPRPAFGKFGGYVVINSRHYPVRFELKTDNTAVCEIADFPAVTATSDTAYDARYTFDCGGPSRLNQLGNDFDEIAGRPVHWAISVNIDGPHAYGGARVQNSDASPGFRLNFPLTASSVVTPTSARPQKAT